MKRRIRRRRKRRRRKRKRRIRRSRKRRRKRRIRRRRKMRRRRRRRRINSCPGRDERKAYKIYFGTPKQAARPNDRPKLQLEVNIKMNIRKSRV